MTNPANLIAFRCCLVSLELSFEFIHGVEFEVLAVITLAERNCSVGVSLQQWPHRRPLLYVKHQASQEIQVVVRFSHYLLMPSSVY